MTHLTRDELVAWRDRPTDGERARVMEHLGACRPCASVYAELLRTAPVEQPARFNPADFVQRGYEVRRSAASAPAWISAMGSWGPWGSALTAAAALVLIVLIVPRLKDDPDVHLRGTGIELTAPAAAAGRPIVLAWSTGLAATSFSVEIKDASGSLVHRATTSEKTMTLPDTVAAALRPGQTYTWTVTALDASGQPITSASSTFLAGAASR
jgi:hypothetical protein